VTGLVQAVRYLTIVPIRRPFAPDGALPAPMDLGRSAVWFPIIGLGLGLCLAAIQSIAARLFPPLLVGLITVATWKVLTGGLHLDGLADCLDGLAGRDAEHRLAIMRDSRIGVFAALGLIVVLLADVAALAETEEGRRWQAVIIAPTIGRAMPAMLARLFPPARPDGHGALFAKGVSRGGAALAVVLAALVAVIARGWAGLLAALAGALAALLAGALLTRRLGGITGDVLGAAVEIAETVVLLAHAAWAQGRP